ncbi:hypothetical protein FE257_006855 [Aspergillus nanangensis]|uniref:Uncharacterized protein n=1 Tax=Aspergillus nanangensis TaxID=2582783 RepID=A0AAD4CB10_ASPNN|nr:hypothetical protein FE257_006855 [Aspergillus nanangensis]
MDHLPQFRFANDKQDDANILYRRVLNARRAKRYRARRKEQQQPYLETPNIGTTAMGPTISYISTEAALSVSSDSLPNLPLSRGSMTGDIYLEYDDSGLNHTDPGSDYQQQASVEPDQLDNTEQGTVSQIPESYMEEETNISSNPGSDLEIQGGRIIIL